ncbi:MAG: hypothetical protein JKY51_11900, partial [Opitutaceae bacterium]|nr:hypothetical protein [Opitutaceae bacterium]
MHSLFRRFAFFFLMGGLLCFANSSQGQTDLRKSLDAFTGEWEGEYKIYALDGNFLRAYKGNRKYVWKDEAQLIESTYQRVGDTKHFEGKNTIRLGRIYSSISRQGRPLEKFEGEIVKGGILWKNTHNKNRNYKEKVVQTSQGAKLEVEGFEVFPAKGISGLVKVVGVFHRPGVVFAEEEKKEAVPVVSLKTDSRNQPLSIQDISQDVEQVSLLEKEMMEASAEIKLLNEKLSMSGDEARRVSADKKSLEKELAQVRKFREELKIALVARETAHQKTSDQLGARSIQLANVEKEHEKRGTANKDLNTQIDGLKSEMASLQTLNTKLLQEKKALEGQVVQVSDQKGEAVRLKSLGEENRLKEVAAVQLLLVASQSQNAKLDTEIKSFSSESSALQHKLELERKFTGEMITKIEALMVENQKLSAMIAQHENRQAGFKTDSESWETTKSSHEQQLKQVSAEKENQAKSHTQELAAIEQKVSLLEDASGEFSSEKSDLLRQIDQLKEEVVKSEKEKKSYLASSAKTAALLVALQSDDVSNEQKITEYQSRLQALERERDFLQKEKRSIEESFSQKHGQSLKAETKLGTLSMQLDRLNKENAVLKEEVNALRQSSSLSLSERSRLDGEGKQLEQEIIYLKGSLSRSEQTAALHLKEKSVADGRLKSLAGENAMLRQNADSMEMKMKAFDQSNAVLTRENKRLVAHQNEYDRMKAANDSLLNGLRSSQSEIASLKNQ